MKRLLQMKLYLASGLIALTGAIVLYRWISSNSSWKLQEQLQIVSPLFLEICFFLLILAVGINYRLIKGLFSGIPRTIWFFLAAITVSGLLITVFAAPRDHRIYYDEDIYLSIGQNIACLKNTGAHAGEDYGSSLSSIWKRWSGRAAMCNEGRHEYGDFFCDRLEYNKEPNGWPYLISIVFRLAGVHENAAFWTTNLLYALSIVTAFGIAYLLFRCPYRGLFAALIFSLTPEYIMWSNTVAVEPSAACFTGLALLSALVYVRSRAGTALFLLTVAAAFACQFRPESIMCLAVIGLAVLFFAGEELKRGRFYLALSLFFILIIPHLVHLYAVKDMGWGSSGPKFSFDYLEGNLKANALFYLKNVRFPVMFTVLFVLGLLLGGRAGEKNGKTFYLYEKTVVFFWFLLFWGIFILFYAGSYDYGADVRFALLSSMPLALLAGCGSVSLAQLFNRRFRYMQFLLALVIIFSFIPFFPFVKAITQEAWGARYDHRYAQEMAKEVPDNGIVLTHNPNMFLLWGKNAAQASLATEQTAYFKRFFYRYPGGIYFHYNFWCNVPDKLQNSFCRNILERYDSTLIKSYKEKDYTYELYKLDKLKQAE
jgi:hypothetical protein